MIVDDWMMLGKTVPEETSDGRVFVCSAGWSMELRQILRVYPLAPGQSPPRWSVSRIALERNPKDSRFESWRIKGDRSQAVHSSINQRFDIVEESVPKKHRAHILKRAFMSSINAANIAHASLAIIRPTAEPELHFEHNPYSPDSPQMKLFDSPAEKRQGSARFAYIPRLRFADEDGNHDLQLRDWGCFEFLRKYGDARRGELRDRLHLGPDSCLLVGNMNNQRKAWLVISVLNGLVDAQQTLPLEELTVNA